MIFSLSAAATNKSFIYDAQWVLDTPNDVLDESKADKRNKFKIEGKTQTNRA